MMNRGFVVSVVSTDMIQMINIHNMNLNTTGFSLVPSTVKQFMVAKSNWMAKKMSCLEELMKGKSQTPHINDPE